MVADGLRERGVPTERASLLSRTVVACFDEALARWLAPDRPPHTLAAELAATLDEPRASVPAQR